MLNKKKPSSAYISAAKLDILGHSTLLLHGTWMKITLFVTVCLKRKKGRASNALSSIFILHHIPNFSRCENPEKEHTITPNVWGGGHSAVRDKGATILLLTQ